MTNEDRKDWNKELEVLEKALQVDFWRAEEGEHIIEFLDNGTERQFEWEEAVIQKVDFKVRIKGKELIWSVTKGKTTSSLYGQIALIGSESGSLVGKKITLYVKGQKMQRHYFVKESSDIIQKRKISNEKVGR
jgi:hypothetical protein